MLLNVNLLLKYSIMTVSNQPLNDKIAYATGLAAAGGVTTPVHVYGQYLTTHGIGLLSYAEWMQVIGSLYIILLALKFVGFFKACCWIYKKIKSVIINRRERKRAIYSNL